MEKIIQSLINNWVRGVDTYTHNGSTWLIFTDKKEWVIELTDDKTLWYNYNFFKQIFEFTSLNVVDNQQYITKWVEDNIINKVNYTEIGWHQCNNIDDAIERGVKKIRKAHMKTDWSVEDTIQNGVKETYLSENSLSKGIEYTIENGVKETKSDDFNVSQFLCEEVINKGAKETNSWNESIIGDLNQNGCIDNVINNGVKETNHVDVMKFFNNKMEDTLKNGVKETKQKKNSYLVLDTSGRELILESHLVVRDGVKKTLSGLHIPGAEMDVNRIIENGVKKISPLDPEFSVRFIDGDENNDWEKVPNINEVIDNGIKETHDDVYHHKGRIDGVIKNCIKETKTPGVNGDLLSTFQWMEENNTKNVPKMIDDIIENGIKETKHANRYEYIGPVVKQSKIENVIENGVKETKGDASQNPMGKVTKVIKYGIKNPTD